MMAALGEEERLESPLDDAKAVSTESILCRTLKKEQKVTAKLATV
jgi:hypothetical protein